MLATLATLAPMMLSFAAVPVPVPVPTTTPEPVPTTTPEPVPTTTPEPVPTTTPEPLTPTVAGVAGKCDAMTSSSQSWGSGFGYGTPEACKAACGDGCICFNVNEADDECEIKTGTCYIRCDGEIDEVDGWSAYFL